MKASLLLLIIGTLSTELPAEALRVDSVDPFIGVDAQPNGWGDGAVFPGATIPFGMLKAGPDMLGGDGNGGWKTGLPIDGFSQMHLSGTGGGAEYGVILVQPTTGALTARGLGSPYQNEQAHPGFFQVDLTRWHVGVELTVARRSALYRIRYAPGDDANIVIDAGHILSSGAQWTNPNSPNEGEDQRLVASAVRIENPREVTGYVTVKGGWAKQTRPYTVYFIAQSDTPGASFGVIDDGVVRPGKEEARVSGGEGAKAFLTFPTGRSGRTAHLRLAISLISVEQARASLRAEMPDFNFDAARERASDLWESALSALTFEGASAEQRTQLYTALYHMMLMPSDRTEENPLWKSNEPSYDDYYAIWDIFRSSTPFLSLLAPDRVAGMVRSLIDIQAHEGFMPDGRKGNFSGVIQGGTDADVMVADALAKRLPGIDVAAAYRAVRADAENETSDPMRVGRRGLSDWKKLGFVSMESSDMQGNRQVEYALNDWCVAQVARLAGDENSYRIFMARSANWRIMFDDTFEAEGFKGFIRPRHRDGRWQSPFNPLEQRSQGYDGFYEGDAWTYSFYAPHDVGGIMAAMGGRNEFVRRLDYYFRARGGDPSRPRYVIGNEPSFLIPYEYIWAGRHDRTADRVRETLATYWNATRAGMPGNDDSGAMSSWYLLGTLGIYPNAGSDIWLIGSPSVARSIIGLPNRKHLVIEAPSTSATNRYVTAAYWNGRPLHQAWLRHADLAAGGLLRLDLSDKPGSWPEGPPPPSASDKRAPAAK